MRNLFVVICCLLFTSFVFAVDDVERLLSEDNSGSIKTMTQSEGTIIAVNGRVFTRVGTEEVWKQLIKGDKIKERSTVITMEDSNVSIKLDNEALIEIGPKSRASFESLKKKPGVANISDTEIKLFVGKVYSNVKRALETGARYEVKTATATAGVRGTQFSVWADEDGQSGLTVYHGIVSLKRNGMKEFILVRPNERVRVDKKGNVGTKESHSEKAPELDSEGANGNTGAGKALKSDNKSKVELADKSKDESASGDNKTTLKDALKKTTGASSEEKNAALDTVDNKWIKENFKVNAPTTPIVTLPKPVVIPIIKSVDTVGNLKVKME